MWDKIQEAAMAFVSKGCDQHHEAKAASNFAFSGHHAELSVGANKINLSRLDRGQLWQLPNQ
jgi:hypothetical protein